VSRFKAKLFIYSCLSLLLSACSVVPIEPGGYYSRAERLHLYELKQWAFDGRLAVSGHNDSWSANISWEHEPGEEKIKLSGPLGQGGMLIRLVGDFVILDRGDGKIESSERPEEFINQQLGMFVPVHSLRYWVVGLPEPSQRFEETSSGFEQAGWHSEYKEMQRAEDETMPRKITVMNDQVKLKLIVDHWNLNDAKAK
jgi:outer membrane lipoprotein LolB